MIEAIIETIAIYSIFSPDEIKKVYDQFKSFDLIIRACAWCSITGTGNLEVACILNQDLSTIEDES